jgi:hypothetical protein
MPYWDYNKDDFQIRLTKDGQFAIISPYQRAINGIFSIIYTSTGVIWCLKSRKIL